MVLKITNTILVGKLKKYRAIKADHIAAAMISLAKSLPSTQILESDSIQDLA